MKHLAVAATLALGLHATLFWVPIRWTQPVMLSSQSRAVDISLVTFQKPVETPAPAKPKKVQPTLRKKTDRLPKPVPKPVVQHRRIPGDVQPKPAPAIVEPMTEPPVEETANESAMATAEKNAAASDEAHAAVKVSVPLYDINPPPVYPRVARRRNFQGTVLLDVRVTADGTAAEVKLVQSSGHHVLDQSALTAVQGWRFEPARRGTHPVETWVQVPVRFELR